MAVIEIYGGRITHRYLMNKSKRDLADMYMQLLDVTDALRARIAELEKPAKPEAPNAS